MSSGRVFDIKKFSIHDGPGIRTTVFLKGCPLGCWWCHNPESQALEPELMVRDNRCIQCGACLDLCSRGAIRQIGEQMVTDPELCTLCGTCVDACYTEARKIVGRTMSVDEVLAAIERDVPFYDESGGGVTFSGGEPLLQPHFLHALLVACRGQEIHTALDTCGLVPWKTVERVRPLVDLFLYDLKLMDDEAHRKYTGVSNKMILKNLQALSQHGHEIIIRVPLIPGINDDHDNLRQIGAFASALPHLRRVDVLAYHPTAEFKYERLNRVYALPRTRPPSDRQVDEVKALLEAHDLTVKIGG